MPPASQTGSAARAKEGTTGPSTASNRNAARDSVELDHRSSVRGSGHGALACREIVPFGFPVSTRSRVRLGTPPRSPAASIRRRRMEILAAGATRAAGERARAARARARARARPGIGSGADRALPCRTARRADAALAGRRDRGRRGARGRRWARCRSAVGAVGAVRGGARRCVRRRGRSIPPRDVRRHARTAALVAGRTGRRPEPDTVTLASRAPASMRGACAGRRRA